MGNWLRQLDGVLRARAFGGAGDGVDALSGRAMRRRALVVFAVLLGSIYGVFMGWYAVRTNGVEGVAQLASSTVKLPLLFLFTVAVTFPSLYVFNTLLGSRLTFRRTLRVVLEWNCVILAVAASVGPILGFFTISTSSYVFIVLLNVLLLGVAGAVGCASLVQRIRAATVAEAVAAGEASGDRGGPVLDIGLRVLVVWIAVFGVVGLQMAWVMRPFIGAPGEPFALFRGTESHVFSAIGRALARLVGIG